MNSKIFITECGHILISIFRLQNGYNNIHQFSNSLTSLVVSVSPMPVPEDFAATIKATVRGLAGAVDQGYGVFDRCHLEHALVVPECTIHSVR